MFGTDPEVQENHSMDFYLFLRRYLIIFFSISILILSSCTSVQPKHHHEKHPIVEENHHGDSKLTCKRDFWVILASDQSLKAGAKEFHRICHHKKKANLIKTHSNRYSFKTVLGPYPHKAEAYHSYEDCYECDIFRKNKPYVKALGPCEVEIVELHCHH